MDGRWELEEVDYVGLEGSRPFSHLLTPRSPSFLSMIVCERQRGGPGGCEKRWRKRRRKGSVHLSQSNCSGSMWICAVG